MSSNKLKQIAILENKLKHQITGKKTNKKASKKRLSSIIKMSEQPDSTLVAEVKISYKVTEKERFANKRSNTMIACVKEMSNESRSKVCIALNFPKF